MTDGIVTLIGIVLVLILNIWLLIDRIKHLKTDWHVERALLITQIKNLQKQLALKNRKRDRYGRFA